MTQIAPFFGTLANRAGASQKAIEDVIFGGPGKFAQSIIGGESMHFERAMDTLSVGYVHPLMQIIFCLWAIGRAGGALAGEIDRGTMELLLAQPIARWRVVASHLLVDAIAIPILCLALWGGTLIGVQIVGPFQVTEADLEAFKGLPFKIVVNPELLAVDPFQFGPALINVAALLFSLSGLTMAISSWGRFRNRVIGGAVLIALVMFLINAVGQLWDVLNPWRPLTLFYYYQPQAIAPQRPLDGRSRRALARGLMASQCRRRARLGRCARLLDRAQYLHSPRSARALVTVSPRPESSRGALPRRRQVAVTTSLLRPNGAAVDSQGWRLCGTPGSPPNPISSSPNGATEFNPKCIAHPIRFRVSGATREARPETTSSNGVFPDPRCIA